MTDNERQELKRFGRPRQEILRRDCYKCLKCDTKWNLGRGNISNLVIDHIDGNGGNSKKPNNDLSNLQTLCRRCHNYKDARKTWFKKANKVGKQFELGHSFLGNRYQRGGE